MKGLSLWLRAKSGFVRRGIGFGKVIRCSIVVRIRVNAVFVPGGSCGNGELIVTGLGC